MTKKEEYLDVTLKGSELLDSIKEDLIEFLSNPKSQKVYQSKDLLNKVYKQIVANLYAANEITQAEVKDKEIVKSKVVRFLKRNKLSIVTTHTQGILNQADQFHKNGKIDFALIFYAMYFEHVINGIIKRRCEQRGLNEKQSNEIIRTTNVLTKFTWLLSLLDLPTFSNTHYKTINLVMEKRNSIIHYKWNDTFDRDKTIDLRKEITDRDKLFRLIESAVKYMKKYETLIKFKKAKTLITKIHKL